MVRVADFRLGGWRFKSWRRALWPLKRVCQYGVFLVSCRGLEAVQACAKKTFFFRSLKNCFSAKPQFSSSYWGKQCFRSPSLSTYRFCVDWKQSKHVRKKTELEKLFFCKARLHLIRPQGVTPQKEKRTARKSSKLRIWQPQSRVPQILKVLCASYSWKYVARLGFEPFKFLYGEFLYNTLAVMWFPAGPVQQTWLRAMNWAMSLELSQGSIESLWAPCLALVVRAWYAKICAKAELCVDLRSFHDDEQVSR